MGELRVTGLDEAVLAQLSLRAEAHGRSVGEEAAEIVKQELERSPASTMGKEEWFERAAEMRRATGRLDVSMVDLIREGRDER